MVSKFHQKYFDFMHNMTVMLLSTFFVSSVCCYLCFFFQIDESAPLNKVCLLGCGISTGYGAALNTGDKFVMINSTKYE